MGNPEKDKKKAPAQQADPFIIGGMNSVAETKVAPATVNNKAAATDPFILGSEKKNVGGNTLLPNESQSNTSATNGEQPSQSASLSGNSVFDLVGGGLNFIKSKVIAPANNLLNDAAESVKAQILKDPDTVKAFKKDVEKHYNDQISQETSSGFTDPFNHTAAVPTVTNRGKQLIKERDNYLNELTNEAATVIGGLEPVEIKYTDAEGKTKYKTEYVTNDKVLPVSYKPLDPKPDTNIDIGKMGAIGKELMKVTNPAQAEQLDANATPYLQQQAQYMGVSARGKYLDAELLKKGKDIINDPIKFKAFTDYQEGNATPEQIQILADSGVKQLCDERVGLANLSNEITHSNPAIREGVLKKAIFNELTNRYGTNQGGILVLGSQGWTTEQLNKVVNDFKKRLTDPRDLRLLDNIAQDKELGILVGDNQSWAHKMQEQFFGSLYKTGDYLTNDLLGVSAANIFDPANSDNRNKEQQLKKLEQSDADKSNVTIDFKPDKKQFFLKQYVDTNPDSETFMQTVENKGEMDGSFVDKVLYNSAAQLGQLAAQVTLAKALPSIGKVGFDLSKAGASAEFIEQKAANFITKVAMPAYAMTYDGNYKQSFDVVGTKDEWKNNLYATLTSGFEGATELLGNPLAQSKFLTSAFKKDIGSFVKALSFDELQKMGKEQFQTALKNVVVKTAKAAGKGGAEMVGEANEEALNDVLTGVTQMVFNPDYTTGSNVVQQAGQTWLQTLASMGFMQTGTVTSATSGWGSKLSQDALAFLAQNREAAVENINQQVADKVFTQDEANEKIHLVNTANLAYEQSKKAAKVQAVTTGKVISKSKLSALTMARTNEIELNNQIKAARETDDTALELSLEDKKKQYVELRTSIINDEMDIDPVTGVPEVPPIGTAPKPQETPETEIQPTANEPVTVPKIKAVKGQSEEQVKAFDVHKNEVNNWLESENTRLRNLFGKVPFKDFKKEYDTVKDTYLKKIGEAVALSQTENDGKNKESNAEAQRGQENGILTESEGAVPEGIVPSNQILPNEESQETAVSIPEAAASIADESVSEVIETTGTSEIKTETVETPSKEVKSDEITKLEEQRDAEINKVNKPDFKLELVSSIDLVNSKDPIGNREKHNELKERDKQLRELIDCL